MYISRQADEKKNNRLFNKKEPLSPRLIIWDGAGAEGPKPRCYGKERTKQHRVDVRKDVDDLSSLFARLRFVIVGEGKGIPFRRQTILQEISLSGVWNGYFHV